ncbi:MAG: hypothetical protein KAH38_00690, partial [Candidatus Hydrogenedentes bacterium]|nr:hypothetical protein [Candidatus Hydrogenedentota bacterium]
MTWLFIAIWLLYTAQAFYKNIYSQGRSSVIGYVLQFMLLLIAVWWAAQAGLFTRVLWSPVDIAVGLALG